MKPLGPFSKIITEVVGNGIYGIRRKPYVRLVAGGSHKRSYIL